MDTAQNRTRYIDQHEEIAHKLMLVGKVIRLGFEKAIVHLYGDDLNFLKEIEKKDPIKVKEDLLQKMLAE